MKFNIKNRPPTLKPNDHHCGDYDWINPQDAANWVEGFCLQTVPRLLKRLDSYKGCIPVDVALQIVREEILGE